MRFPISTASFASSRVSGFVASQLAASPLSPKDTQAQPKSVLELSALQALHSSPLVMQESVLHTVCYAVCALASNWAAYTTYSECGVKLLPATTRPHPWFLRSCKQHCMFGFNRNGCSMYKEREGYASQPGCKYCGCQTAGQVAWPAVLPN